MTDYQTKSSLEVKAEKPKLSFNDKQITGKLGVKKPTLAEKFSGAFIKEDIKTVARVGINDVIIPGIKNMAYQYIMKTVGMIFYGSSFTPTGTGYNNSSWTPYNKIFTQGQQAPFKGNSHAPVHVSKPTMSYKNMPFETESDAWLVLNEMRAYLQQYNSVSVTEYYEALNGLFEKKGLNVPPIKGDWQVGTVGWFNLDNATVGHSGDPQLPYALILPEPVALDSRIGTF